MSCVYHTAFTCRSAAVETFAEVGLADDVPVIVVNEKTTKKLVCLMWNGLRCTQFCARAFRDDHRPAPAGPYFSYGRLENIDNQRLLETVFHLRRLKPLAKENF